jgi:hypothetical protein
MPLHASLYYFYGLGKNCVKKIYVIALKNEIVVTNARSHF